MVRLAECKGSNLITLRLSYNSTAIELISVPVLRKLCQKSLCMAIYHFLPNAVTLNLNPYRKTLSPLYNLVEFPNLFYRISQVEGVPISVPYWWGYL